MTKWKFALLAGLLMLCFSKAAIAAPLTIDLVPDTQNHTVPVMGDHNQFWSTITNTGTKPIDGLVAWISLVEIDPGNEQPVDLEDWSAHKAITGAALGPGQSLKSVWPMRLIKSGDYRVVVSATARDSRSVYTSQTVEFHVQQKPVLQSSRILPVAAGIPVLIIVFIFFNRFKQRRGQSKP